ncbi:bifunctional diguanylate cyclase/phosphodiesterase [Novosphingobium sp. AP12]|uniref:putative bifunctional diguanylate cyclase/phosphodiesterase n=1 Tax=Novosphingobium sp. AP12 TaxID=1144305 RepID=UPI00027205EF|nr:EAL domain-containing protein [Novosphingobium sp. AP12]EJL22643.1 diguanylate cyclase (GGDEF) domain-containing protein [Novosphingobium sp. AP12]
MHRAGQYPLSVAQYLRLREHIPPMYGLLSINAAVLAFTHRGLAPALLVYTFPAILIAACMIRMMTWMRPVVAAELDPAYAKRSMSRTVIVAVLMAPAFVAWSLWLDQYGGPYEHGHVAVFVSVTVLGCVFCLSFLPLAALAVSVIVLGTFLAYSFWIGTEVLIAIACNIVLVAMVILKILRDSYRSFVDLETSQRELHVERRQAQVLGEENARLAQTDALTGMPNRRYFFATLESLLQRSGPDDVFSVGLIDLDRFKPVNDTHGHAHGDRLLQIIGGRMMGQCPGDTIVARLGGDEFGLIVMGGPVQAERVANELCKAIREPARIGDVLVSVGCSAGLAVYPETAASADLLYDRADFALYHAKNHKRGQCVLFSEKLERLIRTEQSIDAALQGADLENELSLVFQPIVATEDLDAIGVECLARWQSPRLGEIAPELLIASAERLGRAREVTLTLFDKALDGLARLPAPLRVSFNLSGNDIGNTGTIDALLARVAASGCDPRRLLIEITESSLIAEMDMANAALERLRETGMRIALDDFGTGYSSLSSLHQLPLDMVKIDRSFATRLDEAAGRRLITAIRHLARSLSLECVIEGIETENQLVSARLAGFSLAQGFFIARPMPLEEMLERLSQPGTAAWSAAG